MPIDKGSERGEQRAPNDWERIDLEFEKRAREQRAYDATHDPSPEWEAAARPLGPDYGKDRPATRTVTPDQVEEMVEMWGQRNVDKLFASGRLVLEADDDSPPDEGHSDPESDRDDRPQRSEDRAAEFHAELADRVPIRPDRPGAKTHGLLASADGTAVWDAPLPSGRDGPAAEIGGASSLRLPTGLVIERHVEAHAAAEMRRQSLDDGVLYINRDPCEGPYGCDEWLPAMLPAGAKLTVYGPDRTARIYHGVEDE